MADDMANFERVVTTTTSDVIAGLDAEGNHLNNRSGIKPSFRGAHGANPESRDSASGTELVIGRRAAPTRWDHPGMTKLTMRIAADDAA
jgi:hypothetical protein